MNPNEFKQWLALRSRPSLVMGILNVTPDSFSDGNCFNTRDKALRRAEDLIKQGADILDIGGESSRPGAVTINADEELERVIPVIEAIQQISPICLSIDTTKARVMQQALEYGVGLINDISALQDIKARELVARFDVPVCLMHMQRTPSTMQLNPSYTHLIDDVNHFFSQRITACVEAGIQRNQIILDPGFGFGKTIEHNLQLINRLHEFLPHQLPLLIGVSRKSTIGLLLNKSVDQRLIGGLSLGIVALQNGASLIRTHDVDETKQAITILQALNHEKMLNE